MALAVLFFSKIRCGDRNGSLPSRVRMKGVIADPRAAHARTKGVGTLRAFGLEAKLAVEPWR